MILSGDRLLLAATDLSNHLACPHLTTLERGRAAGSLAAPPPRGGGRLQALRERGDAHEAAYLEHLRGSGREVTTIGDPEPAAPARTLELMRRGVAAIAQGALGADGWSGRPDLLLRVETPSDLGAHSYEVADTKLARETRAATLLQLCLYSDLLAAIQGRRPEYLSVVMPGRGFLPERFRLAESAAYYRAVKARLEAIVRAELDPAATYPLPASHCEVCRWWQDCDRRWRADDHPTLVAGLSVLHAAQLEAWSVTTLAAVAALADPLPGRPERGSAATYAGLREQAKLQLASRGRAVPAHEIRAGQAGKGLCRLPEPSPGDVFLDFEAARFVEPAGLEYLLGWVTVEAATPEYRALWALDGPAERRNFETFLDLLTARRERHPGFHVFHFGAYDLAALKRLATRYSTREDELDFLLREERFVDLHAVLRQGVRIGVESYSLKQIEACYGLKRATDLHAAGAALLHIERALELGWPDAVEEADRAAVEAYNREDCLSAAGARDWLEQRRQELVAAGAEIPRPPIGAGPPSETLTERKQRTRAVAARLLENIPAEAAARGPEQQAQALLAHSLEFFRREESVGGWEYYRLAALSDEERLEDPAAIAGLEFIETVGGTARCPVHAYRIPQQDVDLRGAPDALAGADDKIGTVTGISADRRTLEITKASKAAERHPSSIFLSTYISTVELEKSLCRLGEWVAENGLDAEAPACRAARDLLLRRPPRGIAPDGFAPRQGEDELAVARRAALALDRGVLPIQGPPGAGKTFTGARMIVELVRQGRRVGITATSHKVIRNLLDGVVAAAAQAGVRVRCLQKGDKGDESCLATESIRVADTNQKVETFLEDGEADVVAGTAWLWAREAMAGKVDVLFVDEAGQVSLATALAVAPAAGSLVLLGDPQQLEQPSKATHPDGVGVSALEHLLGGAPTVPAGRGLFLGRTWRMHPKITEFTSEQFYEGRLESAADLDRQRVVAPRLGEPGLYLLEVGHAGNQNKSVEEAAAIDALVRGWLAAGATFTDKNGATRPLAIDDILVVAPYNVQVGELARRLPPGAKVGTVDKFQGQEAPLVVYSMTSSSPEDAPRGMDFLYSRNRLNVATSRARGACVLVYSPRLLAAACRTPSQIRLANSLCRYAELATRLTPG